MADILENGGRITAKLQPGHALFVRRDMSVQSTTRVKQSVTAPVPLQATLPRFIHNSLFLLRVTTEYSHSRVVITCPGGRQLISIRLAKNECMAVSLPHLVAFTKTRFTGCANFSLAAFACDRNFSTIVHGPGLVILETNGNHIMHKSGTVTTSPDQLVVWDPCLRFRLDRVHDLTDLYFNRMRISCEVNSKLPLIVDSVAKKGRPNSNPLFEFLKSVYLPRFH